MQHLIPPQRFTAPLAGTLTLLAVVLTVTRLLG